MNFGEKLSIVITTLGTSNAEISREGSVDSSLICRFRKGTRIPSKNSVQFVKLVDGICKIVEHKNKSDEILRICGSVPQMKDQLPEILTNWLCSPERINNSVGTQKIGPISKRPRDLQFFGEKLSCLMNVLDVSNVRLARSLNVDASLISRYRNGIRTPNADGEILSKICKYFVNRAVSIDLQSTLARMVGYTSETYNGSKLYDSIYGWLVQHSETSDNELVHRFLEQFNDLSENVSATQLSFKDWEVYNPVSVKEEDSLGILGLRNALKHFISAIAMQNEPHNIYFYMEQNTEHILEDQEVSKLWSTLMTVALKKGCRIRVIHTIDHNISEMFSAIEKWFPYYLSGLMEPYYCRKITDNRFSHTIFVAEDLCTVAARYVRGTESRAKYRYFDAKDDIAYEQDQMQTLLAQCSPLIQVFTQHDIKRYYLKLDEMSRLEGNVAMLLSTPSLYTMPVSLVDKILKRYNFDLAVCNEILACHADHVKIFKESLKNGQVTEFVVTPDDNELLNGRVPNVLCGYTDHKTVYYTEEEYCEHLKHISWLTERYPNYIFKPIAEKQISNIEIIDKSGVGTMVVKTNNPIAIVNFQHPLMCNAFRKYLHSYNDKYLKYSDERENVLGMLLGQKIDL